MSDRIFQIKGHQGDKKLEEKTLQLTQDEIKEFVYEDVLIGASSIMGTRQSQQDAFFAAKDSQNRFALAIVCDGMGGMEGGEIASNTAVSFLKNNISGSVEGKNLRSAMYDSAMEANRLVQSLKNREGKPLKGGSTLIMTAVKDGNLNWLSIGDSKIYLLRGDTMTTLTNEHNYAFHVEKSKNDSNFRYNPKASKEALVSYLGAAKLPYVDINQEPLKLQNDDIVILCSDGLYKSLSEEQIRVMFLSEERNMNRAAEMLTTAALMNMAGGQDNTTVIVLKYKNEEIFA